MQDDHIEETPYGDPPKDHQRNEKESHSLS